MQTLFRNPLAGPFVLGISSGASLGVALLVMAGGLFAVTSSWILVIAAVFGAGLVFLLVVLVSFRIKESTSLLILGLMFSSLAGAIVTILQYFSQAEQIQSYLIWTFGNLGSNSWNDLFILNLVVLMGILMTLAGTKNLNALLMGEYYAQSMGMKVQSARLWIIITTCLLAGSITAFCGPIAFIGLAVPHITRLIFQTSNHRMLVPGSVFIGASLLLFCDIIAQLPGMDATLPINAVTSMIGAPFVIWLILTKKQKSISL
jgi:iron complex transport system permease protein